MKNLPTELASALNAGATTLCLCWRIDRPDGQSLGFTDHDRDIAFEGVTFSASAGLSASRAETSLGLSVGDVTVVGVLNAQSLTEEDLKRGLYDGATVSIYRVDWSMPTTRVLLRTAVVGEVSRGEVGFVAELRSLSDGLAQTQGRRYAFGCDASVGDSRCKVDLTSSAFKADGAVSALTAEPRIFVVSGLSAFASGFFERGRLVWTSGGNTGWSVEVKRHAQSAGTVSVELWATPPLTISSGDGFMVTAGCDKQMGTCKSKFSNLANFRGFPHMPGNDWVATYPVSQDIMDGGSRYRE